MATPVVTPYVLMQELQKARAKGAPADQYGLASAIGSIGKGFDAMNNSIVGANRVRDSNAQTDARMDQNYYPAQTASQVAYFEKQTYDSNQHMSMAKAVEEGHRQAAAQGLKAGMPQYDLFMRDYLSSHAGYNAARGAVPAADKAMTKIQNDAFAKSLVQQGVEKEMQHRLAVEFFQRNGGRPDMSPAEKQALTKQALDYARKHLQENGVQIVLTPEGMVTATGADGTVIPIPPQVVASALMARGNKVPAEVLNLLSKEYRASLDQRRANELAQKKVDTPVPAAKGAPAKDSQYEHLTHLEKLYWSAAGKEGVNLAALEPLKKEIEEIKKSRASGIMSVGGVYDPKSMISKAAGAGLPLVLPDAGQPDVDMYGDVPEEEVDYFGSTQAP